LVICVHNCQLPRVFFIIHKITVTNLIVVNDSASSSPRSNMTCLACYLRGVTCDALCLLPLSPLTGSTLLREAGWALRSQILLQTSRCSATVVYNCRTGQPVALSHMNPPASAPPPLATVVAHLMSRYDMWASSKTQTEKRGTQSSNVDRNFAHSGGVGRRHGLVAAKHKNATPLKKGRYTILVLGCIVTLDLDWTRDSSLPRHPRPESKPSTNNTHFRFIY